MLIIPVLVVALEAAVSSYVLLVCLAQKIRPHRIPAPDALAPVAHRAAAAQSSVLEAEASADAGQDSSYHPPPVPVVVLDPDGRVTVAYLLRVSNQSYLVTQKSDASGSSGSRGDLANRSLSLPTTLPPDRSLSLPASQPAERSLSPPPGWPFRSACPLSPALSANASLAPSEERSSSGSLPAGISRCTSSTASSGSAVSSGGPGCSDCSVDGSASAGADSDPDIECGLPGLFAVKAGSVEGPTTPTAAERRCSSATTSGLPAVEALVQAWAPACE